MKKLSFDEMASHLPVIDDKILPAIKGGTVYTYAQWQALEDHALWQGGYVAGYGYVIQDVVVTPSSYGNAYANPNLTPYTNSYNSTYPTYENMNFDSHDDTTPVTTIGPWDGYIPPADPFEYPDPDHDPTEESGVQWDPLDSDLPTMDVLY